MLDLSNFERKHQFFGLGTILLIIGTLNYFRKIINGYNLNLIGKIMYISTMIMFTCGTIFILYFTDLNNILSFLIGLFVATLSEHIAIFFLHFGNNFDKIVVKFIKKYGKVDLTDELVEKKNDKSTQNNIEQ